MTTRTRTNKRTTPTKILADVYLHTYVGERDVFVKVVCPDDIDQEPLVRQEHIRRFYRWANANLGLKPEDTWDGQLKWARLPKFVFRNGEKVPVVGMLQDCFSLHFVSEGEFYRTEA